VYSIKMKPQVVCAIVVTGLIFVFFNYVIFLK